MYLKLNQDMLLRRNTVSLRTDSVRVSKRPFAGFSKGSRFQCGKSSMF